MIEIRPYQAGDQEVLRSICIATASDPAMSEEKKQLHYLMYNDYYTQFEPDNVFVAVDNGHPIGYIMASSRPEQFEEIMSTQFMPAIAKLDPTKAAQTQGDIDTFKALLPDYTAHLHIDILPGYQGQGLGSQLMERLKEQLRLQKVPGLVLGVSKARPQAVSFYQKNGFKILGGDDGGYLMGIKL